MKTLLIEVTDTKIYTNNEFWGKRYKGQDLGGQVLNVLFYQKKDHTNYKLMVNGKNETRAFKSQVKKEYAGIPNKEYQQRMYNLANVK